MPLFLAFHPYATLALIGPLGPFEILIILTVGLLIFGARLPEVGRSLGKGLMEFKRGLRGIENEWSGLDREADRSIDSELEKRARGVGGTINEDEIAAQGDGLDENDAADLAHGSEDWHPDSESLDDHADDHHGPIWAQEEAGDAQPDSDGDLSSDASSDQKLSDPSTNEKTPPKGGASKA